MENDKLTRIFKALGDSNRITIVRLLMEGEFNATEILSKLNITQPTLSHHMKLLTDSEIIVSRRDGNATLYSVNNEFVNQFASSLFGFFSTSLSSVPGNNPSSDSKGNTVQNSHLNKEAVKGFISRMSHDLRIPVNTIRGMILMARKKNLESNALEDCLSKIESATENLENILDDLIVMDEIENEKDSSLTQPFNLLDNMRECNQTYEALAKKAGITFKYQIEPLKHPYVFANRVYMKRIFQIILGNGIKHTPKNGSIYFSVKEFTPSENTVIHQIVFSDTGYGMNKDDIQKGLEIPEDDKNNLLSKPGLSLVKFLLDKTGGKISVTSNGSSVEINLQLVFEIDRKTEALDENSLKNGVEGKHILLVEDNDLNLGVAEFLLTDSGASVVTAKDGKTAVEIFKNSKEGEFDLILMDLIMPVMNGYVATKIIRSMDRKDTKTIPIIAMSANAFEEDIQKSMEAGMNEHIAKPLNIGTLVNALSKWINGSNER